MSRCLPPAAPAARPGAAFTLVEVLVSMTVLLLILAAITLLFNGALAAIGLRNQHSDADAQAREVFDRMAVDFAQMVRRPDVDYYLKDKVYTPQLGNDQLAFFSQVPGYYLAANGGAAPAVGTQSPVSLVAYRINSNSGSTAYGKLERMGYGLLWNGATATAPALIFSAQSNSTLTPPNTILANWPTATQTGQTETPSHYELAGPQVFRLEYFYLLRGQTLADGTVLAPMPSLTPWDTRITGIPGMTDHKSVAGLQDVSAIVVTLALVDSRSRVNTTDAQLVAFAGKLPDVSDDSSPNMVPGNLAAAWENVVSTTAANVLGRPAAAGIRVYQRYFFLPQNPTP